MPQIIDGKATAAIIKAEIAEIRASIENLDFYTASVADDLNRLNDIFDMGIDFNQEWAEYAKCV